MAKKTTKKTAAQAAQMEKPAEQPPKPEAAVAQPEPAKDDQIQRRDAIAAEGEKAELQQLKQSDAIRTDMMRSIVTEPLLSQVNKAVRDGQPGTTFDIIITLNELFSGGIEGAMKWVQKRADELKVPYSNVSHYIFACLTAKQILDLAAEARQLMKQYGKRGTVVYRIWVDNDISITLTKSLTTVKADAAQRAFQARGNGIVWAVLDCGIQGDHPHFKGLHPLMGPYDTLNVKPPVVHMDFTPHGRANAPDLKPDSDGVTRPKPFPTATQDSFGHGTHVAGIIAGYWHSTNPDGDKVAGSEMRNEASDQPMADPILEREVLREISGVAPLASLVSLKVIADRFPKAGETFKQTPGQGKVSWVLMAIDQIQQWNQNGKRILVQGVNMSVGYDFDPRWFACGQSPLCVEVNRLVRSGVSVVVSAGNGGYAAFVTSAGVQSRYSELSITDPGNAELAITVGSTHREMPHTYGVSYFSSRGPTGDGRLKPDLLAPGERIVSCAAGLQQSKYGTKDDKGQEIGPVLYCEQTGTSMAAPHVSGAVAAFLSVRQEFIGLPEQVKAIFLANTIDLKREPCFQGAGLLDLMKVLQAV